MVKPYEEILADLKGVLGEAPSDAGIEFLENLTDTLEDSKKISAERDELKLKLDENDKVWRKKYIDRFMHGDESDTVEPKPQQKHSYEEIKISDLFKREE